MTIPRLLLLVLLSLALGTAVAGGLALAGGRDAGPPDRARVADPPVEQRVEVAAAGVLGEWDAARAAAWAAGDDAALAALYTPGSVAGRHDRSMLRSWGRRGLTVSGLRMQVLAVRVVSRSATRLVLDVTDRVAGAQVSGAGPTVDLPRDGATRRTVELRRVDGRWRVASVRDASR